MDRAFTFYYPENLEALARAGAELVPFSPLADPRLPAVDGLYLGGGFPEFFLEELEANRDAWGAPGDGGGLPAWAECGGLMYLSRSIRWGAGRRRWPGSSPATSRSTTARPATATSSWRRRGAGPLSAAGRQLRGHEFHHSRLLDLPGDQAFAYRVLRGSGVAWGVDGLVRNNCVAGYTHLHADGAPFWAADFVALVRRAAVGTAG